MSDSASYSEFESAASKRSLDLHGDASGDASSFSAASAHETGSDIGGNVGAPPAKRLRPEDVAGEDDGLRRITTRLLLSKPEFGRVIGKGGQTISQLKRDFKVSIRGDSVSADQFIVIISGQPAQVLRAVEAIVGILFNKQNVHDFSYQVQRLTFLIDNAKVGRLIGAKGATLNSIKTKSGCSSVYLVKEPTDIFGVSLRLLVADGTPVMIQNVHNCILEVLCDPSALIGAPSGMPPSLSAGPAMGGAGAVSAFGEPVQFNSLVRLGLLPETAKQLSDMRDYLASNFHLNLCLFAEPRGGQPAMAPAASMPPTQPGEVRFSVPQNVCGTIIGKEGANLKDLKDEFNVRIFVDREGPDRQRLVRITPVSEPSGARACRDKIVNILRSQFGEVSIIDY